MTKNVLLSTAVHVVKGIKNELEKIKNRDYTK